MTKIYKGVLNCWLYYKQRFGVFGWCYNARVLRLDILFHKKLLVSHDQIEITFWVLYLFHENLIHVHTKLDV